MSKKYINLADTVKGGCHSSKACLSVDSFRPRCIIGLYNSRCLFFYIIAHYLLELMADCEIDRPRRPLKASSQNQE